MDRLSKIFSDKITPLWLLPVFLLFTICNSAPHQQLDSANYYLEGLLTLRGYLPFLEFNDNKGPLLYYLLAIAAWLGGWGMWAGILLFRILDGIIFLTLANLLRLCGFSNGSQVFGLLLFILAYAGCFPFPDETIYSETPELLFRILGYSLYIRSGSATMSGGCFAVALLFRQTAVVDLFVVTIHQLVLLFSKKTNLTKVISHSTQFFTGVLIPVTIVMVLAYQQGWLSEYWHQAFWWNYKFSNSGSETGVRLFLVPLSYLVTLEWFPILLIILVWLLLCAKRLGKLAYSSTSSFSRLLIALALFAHLAESAASPLWYAHHYIPALMIFSIIGADTLDQLVNWLSKNAVMYKLYIALCLPLTLLIILIGLVRFDAFNSYMKEEPPDQEIATWVQEHSVGNDTILVWGYAPQIYLLSQRYPASRFHHNLFLSNQSRRFLPLDEDFISNFRRDIAFKKPKYIILTNGEDAYPDLVEYLPLVALEYKKTAVELTDKEISVLSHTREILSE